MNPIKLSGCIIAILLMSVAALAEDLTQYVNPLMGTQSSFELSAGNTYPAIARPWGMNFWTPQTGKMGDGWIYTYDSHRIRGIRQTHQPSPWINDYGQFSIMATVGAPVFDEDKRSSWFSHKGEECRPYYYRVYLADYDVVAEITPTERAAMFRFRFPESEQSNIVIDAFDNGSQISIDPGKRIVTGFSTRNSGGVPENFRNYFVMEFNREFDSCQLVEDSAVNVNTDNVTCNHAGVIMTFNTKKGEEVEVRVASSFISPQQAIHNLREMEGKSFDQLKEEGRAAWNKELSRIKVEGGNDRRLRTFYSCLYRSLLFPRKFYEIDNKGKIIHYSPHTGKVLPGYMYTDTGLWDTFRALFPLLNLCYPGINTEIQEGMLNHYRESGFIPEWASPGHRNCMVGNNSASVLADAYLSGVRVSDTETLWKAAISGVEAVHPQISSSGRLGHEHYNRLGYIPYDVGVNENVARTLEYAYDDWCLYRLGQALGRPASELKAFRDRAFNYRNVFDKETHLMRGRNEDGTFQKPFSPLKWGDAFTEGNSWHYTWSVFHDPQGLVDLMGGKDNFVSMMDSVFTVAPLYDDSYYGFPIHEIREMTVMNMGNYAHGNQPIQHMIYLYNYAGQPWKAQQKLYDVMERMYTPAPDGYCGDEDNGQTSAWYVFSALGFYPVAPGSGEYVIGTPLFDKATLTFEDGTQTVFTNVSAGEGDPVYIQGIEIDGKNYSPSYFKASDIKSGKNITIRKSDRPNKQWGVLEKDYPYSFSKRR